MATVNIFRFLFFFCFSPLAQGGIEGRDGLVETAVRELHEELGPDMDIWSIGRVPAAYYTYSALPQRLAESGLQGTKVSVNSSLNSYNKGARVETGFLGGGRGCLGLDHAPEDLERTSDD